MRTKILLFIIVALLCTNLITLSFLRESEPVIEDTQSTTHEIELYQLAGEGTKWKVDKYKILKTSKTLRRGSARLVYLGDAKEIDQSTYYNVEIIEDQKVVYTIASSSQGGPVSILLNIEDLGSIESEITEFDMETSRINVEDTQLKITWKDSNDQLNEETIELSIIDELIEV